MFAALIYKLHDSCQQTKERLHLAALSHQLCLLMPNMLHLLQDFFEDVFEEMAQFGEIENLNVCDNLADHMVGNVYLKFRDEEAAASALQVGTEAV